MPPPRPPLLHAKGVVCRTPGTRVLVRPAKCVPKVSYAAPPARACPLPVARKHSTNRWIVNGCDSRPDPSGDLTTLFGPIRPAGAPWVRPSCALPCARLPVVRQHSTNRWIVYGCDSRPDSPGDLTSLFGPIRPAGAPWVRPSCALPCTRLPVARKHSTNRWIVYGRDSRPDSPGDLTSLFGPIRPAGASSARPSRALPCTRRGDHNTYGTVGRSARAIDAARRLGAPVASTLRGGSVPLPPRRFHAASSRTAARCVVVCNTPTMARCSSHWTSTRWTISTPSSSTPSQRTCSSTGRLARRTCWTPGRATRSSIQPNHPHIGSWSLNWRDG